MSDNAKQGKAVGVDHVGYVVNDLDAAVAFFIDELGFKDLNRRAVMRDDEGDSMTTRFNVHPRAVGRYCFLGAGADKVELLEWTGPDCNRTARRTAISAVVISRSKSTIWTPRPLASPARRRDRARAE